MRGRVGFVVAAALAVAGITLGACASDDDPPSASGGAHPADIEPEEYVGDDDDGFYRVPDPLPEGDHGDLVRFQRLPDVAGGRAYRVMYRSVSVPGDPIVVTGLVAVPSGGGNGVVLSFAHGTAGLADRCAPSKNPSSTLDARIGFLLDRGWVVAGTDYEGLATPGLHPFLAGISEGRGTLDIVRAASQLPGVSAGKKKTLIWGHSQGGHAALFAGQLASTWAPGLEVVGTVAGAPPSELDQLAATLRGGPFQGYVAMSAGGLHAAYPEAELSLVLTPTGIDLLRVLDEGCTSEIFDVFDDVAYDDVVRADPATVEPWRTILAENDPGRELLGSPLLLIHGEADEQIPVSMSRQLFERLCRLGQVVERRTYPGAGHAEVIVPSLLGMLAWMEDRVAGRPAVNGCAD